MIVITNEQETFEIAGRRITAIPDFIFRDDEDSMTVLCFNTMLFDHNDENFIRRQCFCEDFANTFNDNIYIVIPDKSDPYVCMFTCDVVNDIGFRHFIKHYSRTIPYNCVVRF